MKARSYNPILGIVSKFCLENYITNYMPKMIILKTKIGLLHLEKTTPFLMSEAITKS